MLLSIGRIVTIETVPLKLPKKHWTSLEINPDQTYFPDDYLRHILYITRIYFRYGDPETELIGRHALTTTLLVADIDDSAIVIVPEGL